jgi:predicted PurR-regulated permease PerM
VDRELGIFGDFTMAIELFYLTAQIQRWLNQRVARHLAAQAERLAR